MKDKLKKFQEFIDYKFKNEDLLEQALTTPQLANIIGKPNYEFLETLGDAVIKLILILKLYRKGIKDPGRITKIKALLESDQALNKVANEINLENFIFKTEKQPIKGTRVLADVLEAICGALFLDSKHDLDLVEEKMINPFFKNLNFIIKNSIKQGKSTLLEYLQKRFKTNVSISLEYEKSGLEHEPNWIAKSPKIFDKNTQVELMKLPITLKSGKFRNIKNAEKDLYFKIFDFIKTNEK